VHLSVFGWVSVGLGLVIAFARLAMVAYLAKGQARAAYANFKAWMVLGSLIVLVSLPALFLASCRQYTYIYWVLGFLYLASEFAVIYELAVNALKPYSALIDLAKLVFLWALLFLLIVASITAVTTVGAHSTKLDAAVAVLERSLRLIECGILLLFFLFEDRLGLSWRNMNVSIALGLGLTAAVDLIFSYLRASYPLYGYVFDSVYGAMFIGVLSFWFYCLAHRTHKEKSNVLDSPNRLIFQRWNEALIGYQHGGDLAFAPSESFLPSVERTVERVMARKMAN
jgi:hypothetical protein